MVGRIKRIALGLSLYGAGCGALLLWGTRFTPGPGMVCDAALYIGFGAACVITGTAVAAGSDV